MSVKEKMKTPEQAKEYRHEYYVQHKKYHYQKFCDWRRDNPEKAAAIQKRWRDAHPHYYRDYMRKRKAAAEPLIFDFFDNNFNDDVDGFILHLQQEGIPEKHIRWFKVDVQKHLQGI